MLATFYSYKGGVGRTFGLVNIAVVLARWGHRVLCVDWDLEAPGMHDYLAEWSTAEPGPGVVDWISTLSAGHPLSWRRCVLRLDRLDVPGGIDFLPAGRLDAGYPQRMQAIDWEAEYANNDLGGELERFREQALAEYDFVFVDSRTGITDIGGICTAQLPDILVLCLTANNQSLRGALDVAQRAVVARDGLPYDRGGLLTLPILSRFEGREEYHKAFAWRERIATGLENIYGMWAPNTASAIDLLERTTVPYVPIFSFGEELPALWERTSDPLAVTATFETIAALLAHRLTKVPMLLTARERYLDDAHSPALRLSPDPAASVIGPPSDIRIALIGANERTILDVVTPSEPARPSFVMVPNGRSGSVEVGVRNTLAYNQTAGWPTWLVKAYHCETFGDADVVRSRFRSQARIITEINRSLSRRAAAGEPWAFVPLHVVQGDSSGEAALDAELGPVDASIRRVEPGVAAWFGEEPSQAGRTILTISPVVERLAWGSQSPAPRTEHLIDFQNLAAGVDALHRLGWAHCDITPDNIGRYHTANSRGFVVIDVEGLTEVAPPPAGVRIAAAYSYRPLRAGFLLSEPGTVISAKLLWAQDRFGFALVVLTALAGGEWVHLNLLSPRSGPDGERVVDDAAAVARALRDLWPDSDSRRWQPLISALAEPFGPDIEVPDWSAHAWLARVQAAERAAVGPNVSSVDIQSARSVQRYARDLERIRASAATPAPRAELVQRGYQVVDSAGQWVARRAAIHATLWTFATVLALFALVAYVLWTGAV